MASIIIPQRPATAKNQNPDAGKWGAYGTVGGALIGAAIGGATAGPAGAFIGAGKGAMAGAGYGGTIGSVGEALLGPKSSGGYNQPMEVKGVDTNTPSAMQRRQLAQQDPYEALKQANVALEYAPKDIQDAYRKPLSEALTIAYKQRGGGVA